MSTERTKTRYAHISKVVTVCRATGEKVTRYEVKFRKKMQDGTVVDYQKRFDTLRQAEAEKAAALAAIAAGTYQPPTRSKQATINALQATASPQVTATVAEGLEIYITHLKKAKAFGLSRRMENELRAIGRRPVGATLVAELDARVLDEYAISRKADGVALPTISKELSLLKRFRRVAVDLELAGAVPNLRTSIGLRRSERRVRRPQGDELARILAWLQQQDPPTYWAARLAVATACRQQELATAKWADFDQETGVLWLAAAQTKTKKQRGVPLLTEALGILEHIPKDLGPRPELILGGISPYRICTGWRRACKHCGIKGLRFHDLRREAISRLASLGLADRQLMIFSGHTQASMLSVYTVLNPAALAQQVRQIEAQRYQLT
ncbi:MAG: site-specific integrase [Chitinivorax sp.]